MLYSHVFLMTISNLYHLQVYSGDIFKEGPAADAIVSIINYVYTFYILIKTMQKKIQCSFQNKKYI